VDPVTDGPSVPRIIPVEGFRCRGTMYCAIATARAKPGMLEKLVTAANAHAQALRRQPGCIAAYVLAEHDGPVQVSISIFEDERHLAAALEATRSVIAGFDLARLTEGPHQFQAFDVR
jgi:quinol monooxygenase YgiN